MAYIATVPPARAEGQTAATYRALAAMTGTSAVARIVQVFSLRPASMRWMIRAWELAMWTGDEPRAARELVGAMVSRLNDCHY